MLAYGLSLGVLLLWLAESPTPTGAMDASGLPLDQVEPGWRVYDNDQNYRLGTVVAATSRGLSVRTGPLRGRVLFVPARLVGSVDARRRRIFLTQARRTLKLMRLTEEPSGAESPERDG